MYQGEHLDTVLANDIHMLGEPPEYLDVPCELEQPNPNEFAQSLVCDANPQVDFKFLIRASSVGSLMKKSRNKSSELSETAKSMIDKMVVEYCYGVHTDFTSKQTEKGLLLEPIAIEVYNQVHFSMYEKNNVRKSNRFVTGMPDLLGDVEVIDLKVSWDLLNFHKMRSESNVDYEWQLRTYMWLFDKHVAWNAYVLLETPRELLYGDDGDDYSHLPLQDRVIINNIIERDAWHEEQIQEKFYAAERYFLEQVECFKDTGRNVPTELMSKYSKAAGGIHV